MINHAGNILYHEFLFPLGMTVIDLSEKTGIAEGHLEELVKHGKGLTSKIDNELCKCFGMPQGYFLRLQKWYDEVECAKTIIHF